MTGIFSNFMNLPTHYLKFGSWFQISYSNLIVIGIMFAIFALALAIPFPKHHAKANTKQDGLHHD